MRLIRRLCDLAYRYIIETGKVNQAAYDSFVDVSSGLNSRMSMTSGFSTLSHLEQYTLFACLF